MRNAVLTILAHVISEKLSGENLDEKERQVRDSGLDFLEVMKCKGQNFIFNKFPFNLGTFPR